MPRKSISRARQSAPLEPNVATPGAAAAACVEPEIPISTRARRLASVVIVFHFTAILIALASNLAPSYLQDKLLGGLSPYLTTTHQSYGAVPLELTHGDPIDFPVDVEIQTNTPHWSQCRQAFLDNNSMGSRWPNLARILHIIAVNAPDDELLSEMGTRFVRYLEHVEESEISAIRFIQPHVLDVEEYAAVSSGALSASDFEAEVIFSAKVVRTADGLLGLVPEQEAYRISPVSNGSQFGKSTQP